MSRRVFLKSLTALLGGFSLPAIAYTKPDPERWKTLQISPVAEFQYCQGETLWPQLLDHGEKLSALIVGLKKSNNPWDRIMVEVQWRA